MWDSIILYFKLCLSGHIISQILVTPYWFKFRATLQPKLLIISFFVKKKKKKKSRFQLAIDEFVCTCASKLSHEEFKTQHNKYIMSSQQIEEILSFA